LNPAAIEAPVGAGEKPQINADRATRMDCAAVTVYRADHSKKRHRLSGSGTAPLRFAPLR